MAITVWETPNCVQCKATTRQLDSEGAVYDRKDLSAPEHAETLAAFREQLGGHSEAVLQMPVVTTPTETWQGYQPDRIKQATQQQVSQQAAMLQAPAVPGPGVG